MTPCPLGLTGQCYCANRVSSFAAGEGPAKVAVLLLAHGSPENPDQIPEFLGYVTGGRPLPPAVVEEIRHRYSLIGFSPLACWTTRQADQLAQWLKMPVFVGMRNWRPFIADAVKAIAKKAIELQTGARALRSIMEGLMLEVMYELPQHNDVEEVVIGAGVVAGLHRPVLRRHAKSEPAQNAA